MQFKALFVITIFVAVAMAQFGGETGYRKPTKLRGIDKIGIGFDIVSNTLKLSPLELTYMGQTIISPYDNVEYEIPMEVASISTPNTFINTTTNVWNTVEEFQTTKARSSGISLSGSFGPVTFAFTNTNEYRQIRYTMDNRSFRFGVSEQTHTFFDVKLFPPFLLRPSLQMTRYLSMLPRFSEQTKTAWFGFFNYFGTHYVMQAELGGSIRRNHLAEITNLTRLDEDYVKKQFAISFSYGTTPSSDAPFTNQPAGNPTNGATPGQPIPTRGAAGAPVALGKKRTTTTDTTLEQRDKRQFSFGFSYNQMREDLNRQLEIKYKENAHTFTRLIGGDPTIYDPAEWRTWAGTVAANPVIVTYTLESIAELIEDPIMKADMEQAIHLRNNTPR